MEVRRGYLKKAPEEGKLHEGKDHIPFVLEQLSKEPYSLPKLEVKLNMPLFELIEKSAGEVFELRDYKYHKWNSKARMAA